MRSQAVFGLVGVILGGVLSGGVTFVMVRREERRAAQASARLLHDELRQIAISFRDFLAQGTDVGDSAEPSPVLNSRYHDHWPLPGLTDFSMDRWQEHKPLLAKTVTTEDWYAISRAYEAIRAGARLEAEYAAKGHLISRGQIGL